jgi:hypothetical protein
MRNFAFIIDTYPSSKEERDLLLDNIKNIKNEGIDIILTSHHTLDNEIIQNVDYFLFEKSNNYHYLDSDILNNDLSNLGNPIFMKYYDTGTEVICDRIVNTGWSVAITSQMFNAINLLYTKGYDYAFYLVGDFKYPKNGFLSKINEIFERLGEKRNYFIRNSDHFSSWYAGFFFGFKIDEILINKIPKEDFSKNKVYQKYFPNCAAEDVIIKIWGNDLNIVDPHEKLEYIFDGNNWNLIQSGVRKGSGSLNYCVSSDVYVNVNNTSNKYCLYLYQSHEYNSQTSISIRIFDEMNNIIFNLQRNFGMGFWYKEYLDAYFIGKSKIRIEKEILDLNDNSVFVKDSIYLDLNNIEKYAIIKNFYNK